MSAAYVSAIVAGLAVALSGVMQYLTLRRAREDAEKTVTATERTARITALSSATTIWEQGLREDLATFGTLTYEVESAFNSATDHKAPWPGEHAGKVAEESTLFNRILMRLDRSVTAERDLIECIEAMRDDKKTLWIERQRRLVDAALPAFRSRWAANLEAQAQFSSKSAKVRAAKVG